MEKTLILLICLCFSSFMLPAHAEDDALSQADLAVANILFDYENSNEYASYKIGEDGFVDIIFSNNIPDELYVTIIDRMNAHPHIKGVLASKDGPSCKVSFGNW